MTLRKTKSALELKLKEQENAHQAELTTLKTLRYNSARLSNFTICSVLVLILSFTKNV